MVTLLLVAIGVMQTLPRARGHESNTHTQNDESRYTEPKNCQCVQHAHTAVLVLLAQYSTK